MILGEVADLHFMSPLHFAGIDAEPFTAYSRCIAEQRPDQSGLPGAVASDQCDLLAAIDCGAKGLDHNFVAMRLREILELERMSSRRTIHRELDVRTRDVRPR